MACKAQIAITLSAAIAKNALNHWFSILKIRKIIHISKLFYWFSERKKKILPPSAGKRGGKKKTAEGGKEKRG